MKKIARIAITIMVVFAFPLYVFTQETRAAVLTSASVSMLDSRPSQAAVAYTFTFSGVTASNIKCIKVQFSDAVVGGSKPTGMTLAAGLDVSASSYLTGLTGWDADKTVTDATGLFTMFNATGGVPGNGNIVFTADITNGSTVAVPYYARFNSYDNVDCATTPRDSAVVAFIYTDGVTVSATVDPSLSFAVTGVNTGQTHNGATTNVISTATTVPFGVVTTATNKVGGNILTLGTNAGGGATVFTRNTQLMTAPGPFTILAHTGTNASPSAFPAAGATEAFGYTTDDDLSTGGEGATRFQSNEWAGFETTFPGNEVYYTGGPIEATAKRVLMQISITSATEAGTYTTVVEYSAVPIY